MREQIGLSGAIICILNAMRMFPTEKKLQEACTWALHNLSQNTKCAEIMRKEATVELLMESARNFSEVDVIQNHVSSCISALGEGQISKIKKKRERKSKREKGEKKKKKKKN